MAGDCVQGNPLRREYARKSEEMLDYVASLEEAVQRLKAEAEDDRRRLREERCDVRRQIQCAVEKVIEAQRECQKHATARNEACQKLACTEARLIQEECRRKDLEAKILSLENQTLDLMRHYDDKRKEDPGKESQKNTQKENMRQKSTLAWMLGCLADGYLKSETLDPNSLAMLRMIRKLQRQMEQDNINVHGGTIEASPAEYQCVENEIRRLLELPEVSNGDNQLELTKSDRSLNVEDYLMGKVKKGKKKDARSRSPKRNDGTRDFDGQGASRGHLRCYACNPRNEEDDN